MRSSTKASFLSKGSTLALAGALAGGLAVGAASAQTDQNSGARDQSAASDQSGLMVRHTTAAEPVERLQESVRELREATLLMQRRQNSPDREKAVAAAQDALRAAQKAMLELPADMRVESARLREAKDWPLAMDRLDKATQSLQKSAEDLKNMPAGEDRDAAIKAIQDALEKTQRAMAALPDWKPGSPQLGAGQDRQAANQDMGDRGDRQRNGRQSGDQDRSSGEGFIGVQIQGITGELAEGLGLAGDRGAIVADVRRGSPADNAGLRAGDVITEVDGQQVDTARDLSRMVSRERPGTQVDVTYIRNGRERTASVTIGARPSRGFQGRDGRRDRDRDQDRRGDRSDGPRLGITLAPGDNGVSIAEIENDSAAERSGLRQGDVIVEVGGERVSSPGDVVDAVRAARREDRKVILMRVRRDGAIRFVAVSMNGR